MSVFSRRQVLSSLSAGAMGLLVLNKKMASATVDQGQTPDVDISAEDTRGIVRIKPVFVGITRYFPWNYPTSPNTIEELEKKTLEMIDDFKKGSDLDFIRIEKPFIINEHRDYIKLKSELTYDTDALLVGRYRVSTLDNIPLEKIGLPIIDNSVSSDFLRALRVKKMLSESKILYIGEFPSISVGTESTINLFDCQESFGVRVRQIETNEFYSIFDSFKAEEVKKELSNWMKDFGEIIEPSNEHLMDMTRVYLALKALALREDANGLAVNCNSMVIQGKRHVVPCMAFNRIIDEGIMCACEGDLGAMISALILNAVSGEQAVLMGNFRLRPDEDIIYIQHDIIPQKMAKTKYELYDYHGKKWGVTGYADIKPNPMTVLNIDPSYKKICVIEGNIKGSHIPELPSGLKTCRFRVDMSVDGGSVKDIPSIMVGTNHNSMTFGHWLPALLEAGKLLNLEVNHLSDLK